MKKQFFFGMIMAFSLFSCRDTTNVNLIVEDNAPNAADGFNLEQFHKLLLEEKPSSGEWDAKFLSDLVNREDINNLDLNHDGKTDQIFVEPFGTADAPGFQLYSEVVDEAGAKQEQEIAKIAIEKEGADKAGLHVSGNENIYGAGHHYHSPGLGLGDYFMLRWMFSPGYPMGGGFYGSWYGPGYYSPRATRTYDSYRSSMDSRNQQYSTNNPSAKPTPVAQRGTTQPDVVKNAAVKQRTAASGIKSKLNNPTASQRQFKASHDATVAKSRGSGFGQRRSSGTSKGGSWGRSGGFGGGGK